jgi:sulfatase maturation enzyme AslB (radical SAM superfamily)
MSTAINRILANGSYCALPFVHSYLNLDGNYYLCCYSNVKLNGDQEIKQLRSKILAGEKIDHCNKCYNWEQQGSISPRIKETIGLLKNSRIVESLENSMADIDNSELLSYDLRFDNRCNLACIGCNPKDSSLWARKLKISNEVVESQMPDVEQVADSEKIYLAGGEPLINDKVYQLLSAIAQRSHQPEVVINSNIASIKDKFFDVLSNLNKLSVTVSFDGHSRVNEYHRWPLQWDKFLSNLQKLKEMKTYVSWNTVIDAVSVWGVKDMIDIENLTQSWNLRVLTDPKPLLLRNLPNNLKTQAQQQLESLSNSRFVTTDPVFRTRIDLAKAELQTPGDEILLSNYITRLDQQRKINHEHYLGVKLT